MKIYPIVENENETQITNYRQSYEKACFNTKLNIKTMFNSFEFFNGMLCLGGGACLTTIALVLPKGVHTLFALAPGMVFLGASVALLTPYAVYAGYQGIKILPKYVEYKKLSQKHKLQNTKKQEEKLL